MTTLFFNQVEEQVINQVNNNLPTQEEILLSQADENIYLNPISNNTKKQKESLCSN